MPRVRGAGRASWRWVWARLRWPSPSSVAAPMATIVLGLVFFGVLAATLSSRYLVGRFAALLDPAFVRLLGALVTGVVVCGLLSRVVGRPAELVGIALGYGVLAAAVRQWSGSEAGRRVVAWAVLAAALALSLAFPAYHLVVIGQLLMLAPLGFLWEWSRGLPRDRRPARLPRRAAARLRRGARAAARRRAGPVADDRPRAGAQRRRRRRGHPARHDPAGHRGHAPRRADARPLGLPRHPRVCRVARLLPPRGPRVRPRPSRRGCRGRRARGCGRAPSRPRPASPSSSRSTSGAPTAVLGAVSAYPVLLGVALLVVLAGSGGPSGGRSGGREKVLPPARESTYGRSTEPEGRWSEK